jgi:hypothetical protein
LGDISARRFALGAAVAAAAISLIPFLYGWLAAPRGAVYLGFQYNTDDHMVYAAWMRQAMDGSFFLDNRFAVEEQPGLTVHLYFYLLGLIAKFTGIPLAAALGRAVFSGLFVWLLYLLLRRLTPEPLVIRLGIVITVVGGGLGFLLWHTFGVHIVHPAPEPLSTFLLGRLPTDVWQPEGFVWPSMLTNGLFMISLCLIVGIFLCVIAARESWRPVLPGAVMFLVLMNIHSYDVLLIALVLIGLLVMSLIQRQASGAWVGRVLAMGAGALPAALWFLHVLRNDPVFQARAATDTPSPNFRQFLLGYILLIGLAFIGFLARDSAARGRRSQAGAIGLLSLLVALAAAAQYHLDGYWMGPIAFVVVFAASLGVLALWSPQSTAHNLMVSWAVVGLIAPYFPALFQRKLSMGLAVPWAILAALGLGAALLRLRGALRPLVIALTLLLVGATSVRWTLREFDLIHANISNTTLHPVDLEQEAMAALNVLAREPGRKVVLAMPGIRLQPPDIPDAFVLYLPELNPFASGFAGAYAYAGHWSETPDYAERRMEVTRFFLAGTDPAQRRALIEKAGVTHLLAPIPEAFADMPMLAGGRGLADLRGLGEIIADGPRFQLIRLAPPPEP